MIFLLFLVLMNEQYINKIIQQEINKVKIMNNNSRIKYISSKKVIKRYKNNSLFCDGVYLLNNFFIAKKMKKDTHAFVFWKNEINNLIKLKDFPYFPKIIAIDPGNLIIYMTYCGENLEDNINLPINWKKQVNEISEILIKKNINPNDILPKNICILNGIIKIIDFGLANNNYKDLKKSLLKLENILFIKSRTRLS